jgi:high-affinity K+ transport system ATPase subunit B
MFLNVLLIHLDMVFLLVYESNAPYAAYEQRQK